MPAATVWIPIPAGGLSLAQVHKPGSQQEDNRGEAIWAMNLGPARQGASRRDELLSGNLFVSGEAQQGDPKFGLDRR